MKAEKPEVLNMMRVKNGMDVSRKARLEYVTKFKGFYRGWKADGFKNFSQLKCGCLSFLKQSNTATNW